MQLTTIRCPCYHYHYHYRYRYQRSVIRCYLEKNDGYNVLKSAWYSGALWAS